VNNIKSLIRPSFAAKSAATLLLSLAFAGASNAESGKQWTTYGGDASNTRYSSLTEINTKNVKTLKVAWAFSLGVLDAQESTPLVIGDTLYVTSPQGPKYVYALDAKSGALKWRYAPELAADVGTSGCCGAVSRGAAFASGKLFVGRLDGHLVALDAATGKELWNTKVTDYKTGAYITSPPTVVKNLVVTGYTGGEYANRGSIIAYDQETGEEVWRTYTTPAPGEPGSETWQPREAAVRGGGNAWLVGSYDPKLNLVYYGTGNASPWAANARGPDSSDYGKITNLYTASTLALDADTGKIVWHFQSTPYDAWDFDGVNEKVLADINVGGKAVQGMMWADRNGFFYVLDRQSGKMVSAAPFTHVTWAEGIGPDGRPKEVPDRRPRKDNWAKDVCPSIYGGKNYMPVSYSMQTKLVYIPAFNLCTDMVARDPGEPKKGYLFVGDEFDCCKLGPGGNGGELVAWDPVTQKKVWGAKESMGFVGGALTTASGLVFYGNMQGELKALDAKSGDVLWRFQSGSGISQGPITYQIDGKQYVAAMSGHVIGSLAFAGELGQKWLAANPEGASLFVFELPSP
jgi:alcohol dehydrogenase (cytochrome c)